MNTLLEFCDLSISYPKRARPAVDHVSFAVPEGAIVVVVGESGSGKSTLLRAALRLLPGEGTISGGSIRFGDTELTALSERDMRRLRGERIGMIFQDAGLYMDSRKTIRYQYIESIRAHLKLSAAEAEALARDMFSRMALTEPERILSAYPFELSGGQKQRAAIAMAMTMKPDLLLADEPTSALDVTVQAQVVRQIMQLRAQFGTTVLLVTHNMGVASFMADYIAVMQGGRLVEWGPKAQVIEAPQSAYTQKLLAAVPELVV